MNYKVEGLNDLSKQFHEFQVNAGFTDSNITQRLMLTASEIFEAFEAFRKGRRAFEDQKHGSNEGEEKILLSDLETFNTGKEYWMDLFQKHVKDSLEDEMADVIIRALGFCAENNIDIEKHIQLKMKYNEMRGFKYGGKKF